MNTQKILSVLIGICLLWACDDDDHGPGITAEAQKAFSEKYPTATYVSWETKGTYFVAEFKEGSQSSDAWFNATGQWFMTETDLNWAQLPKSIQDAFSSSEYAQWKIEDVDQLERKEAETLYILEIEQGEQELDLYFNPTGVLIQAINHKDDDHQGLLPQPIPDKIKNTVLEMYPNARLVDQETEHGITEVTIIDGTKSKEVKFNSSAEWLETEYDITVAEIPNTVVVTLNAQYPSSYVIDDAECHETPSGKFYHFEIEANGRESEINIREDGTIQ